MDLFIAQFLNGVSSGVVFGSVALALVLIYRSTGILNFAQGEMALFATYMTWQFTDWGIGVVGAIALSMAFAFVAGAVIERVLIRPVEGAHNPLNVVIVTLGMFLAINALALIIFGTTERKVPYVFPTDSWDVLGTNVAKETVGMAAVLAAECVFLWALLQKTKIGLRLRAVASNPESSRLVGINTGAMLMLGWGLAAAIGALAGSLFAAGETAFAGSSMQIILVYAFAAAALGGFDSLVGAVVGGLVVGVANALTIQYVDLLDGIELAMPLGLILAVLLVRPTGLFGKRHVERV
ncbi:MAG TPA: branched-chain amino acid ABC transporter permease [Acidimicrobiales bacterium]